MSDLSRALVRMLVEKILDEVFPGETGAARLQQVGLFTVIYAFGDDAEPVTAARIASLSGLSPSQVHKQLQKLIGLDLVERTKVLNRQGRGYAWHLSIRHTAQTRKLLKAIEKGSAGKSSKRAR
jgi:DNA-binding transcriptional ArsR family regulator